MGMKKLLSGFGIDGRSGYSLADLIMVFKILSRGPMGRILLMKELGLGEATVKTIVKNLRRQGFTRHSTKGEVLTGKGRKIADYLESKVSRAFIVRLPVISKKPTVAIVVRKASGKVKMGIEQRDEGMKMGVNVTTLVLKDGQASFPGTGEIAGGLENLEANDGDIIIIASGETIKKAERGGIAAALTLI